jgi:DNA polymerase-1
MINTWLNAYNEKTGAIHGQLWLAGSLRYRHDNPNSANIPAVRVGKSGSPILGEEGSFTYESRDLWTCGDRNKYSLVGVDAKGIQLRVLAHYLGDEEFNKAILSEDPHSYNQHAWGLDTRAKAKTILYAIVMGAGDGRVAQEANISLKEAKATKKQLFDRVPGFPKLINRLQAEQQRTGRIKLCDGTPVIVPKDYRVIPYLLQGDESKLMKQASVYLDELIRKNKIEAYKCADVHDEWQYRVLNEQLELFVELALSVFPRAGQSFNYTIPIEGDAKVGKTWAETH